MIRAPLSPTTAVSLFLPSWSPVTTPVSGYHIPHMVRAADGVFYVAFTQGAGPGATGPGRLYKFDGTNWTLLASTNAYGYGSVSVFGFQPSGLRM